MKRYLFTSIAVLIASVCSANSAQKAEGLGILGGFTSSSTKIQYLDVKHVSLYHVGLTYKVPIVAGFAVQPAITYQMKGAEVCQQSLIDFKCNSRVGYLEIPVQLQWGPDLIAFRPYVLAEPFLGYAVSKKTSASIAGASIETSKDQFTDYLNDLEYGFALGGGIEVWRLQISAKYFWNFGTLMGDDGKLDWSKFPRDVRDYIKEQKSYNGIAITLGLFF